MQTIAVLPDEAELVARSAAEPAAFAAVYDHYLPRLYKYMRYRVGDINEAEELTSRVFEQVLTKIGSYRPERGPFAGWLFAIAHNAVVDHLRTRKRRSWVPLEVLGEAACAGTGPEEAVICNESRKRQSGISFAEGVEVKVVEESGELRCLVLPNSGELTDEQLADVGGGFVGLWAEVDLAIMWSTSSKTREGVKNEDEDAKPKKKEKERKRKKGLFL